MSDQDDRLQALFQDAAGTPPEAGFSYGDVTRASGRITRRRRTALSAVAAVVVATAGTGVVVAAARDQGTTTSASSAGAVAPENSPRMGRADPASGAAAPLGPSSAQCVDKNDPQLRAIVEQVLPEIAGAADAAVTLECELGGGRQVNVEVTGGGASGLLNVTYVPAGRPARPVVGGGGGPPRPVVGALSAPTASGGTVSVSSEGVGSDAAPFAAKLPAVLAYLASRL